MKFTNITIKQARALRSAMLEVSPTLSDKTASTVPMMFSGMKYDNSPISAGTRINWKGVIKKATVTLWDTLESNPDNAPTLWEDIPYRDGIRIIPEVITVTSIFAKGEQGWWGDSLYESLLDVNTYTPDQYPDGWKQVTQ